MSQEVKLLEGCLEQNLSDSSYHDPLCCLKYFIAIPR